MTATTRGRKTKAVSPVALVKAIPVEGWIAEFATEDDEGSNPQTVAAIVFMADADGIRPLAIVGGVGGFAVADFEDCFLGVHAEDDDSGAWDEQASSWWEQGRRREKSRGRKRSPRMTRRCGEDPADRDDDDKDVH